MIRGGLSIDTSEPWLETLLTPVICCRPTLPGSELKSMNRPSGDTLPFHWATVCDCTAPIARSRTGRQCTLNPAARRYVSGLLNVPELVILTTSTK